MTLPPSYQCDRFLLVVCWSNPNSHSNTKKIQKYKIHHFSKKIEKRRRKKKGNLEIHVPIVHQHQTVKYYQCTTRRPFFLLHEKMSRRRSIRRGGVQEENATRVQIQLHENAPLEEETDSPPRHTEYPDTSFDSSRLSQAKQFTDVETEAR